MTVCGKCSKHGKITWENKKPRSVRLGAKVTAKISPLMISSRSPSQVDVGSTLELVEDFEVRIRRAREKMSLSHEDLGKEINEKISVLRKIERGKMTPDNKLAVKLEHSLKIELLVQTSRQKIPKIEIHRPANHKPTLGDLVTLEKKKAEEKTEREQ